MRQLLILGLLGLTLGGCSERQPSEATPSFSNSKNTGVVETSEPLPLEDTEEPISQEEVDAPETRDESEKSHKSKNSIAIPIAATAGLAALGGLAAYLSSEDEREEKREQKKALEKEYHGILNTLLEQEEVYPRGVLSKEEWALLKERDEARNHSWLPKFKNRPSFRRTEVIIQEMRSIQNQINHLVQQDLEGREAQADGHVREHLGHRLEMIKNEVQILQQLYPSPQLETRVKSLQSQLVRIRERERSAPPEDMVAPAHKKEENGLENAEPEPQSLPTSNVPAERELVEHFPSL
jgi:hypothetical protein